MFVQRARMRIGRVSQERVTTRYFRRVLQEVNSGLTVATPGRSCHVSPSHFRVDGVPVPFLFPPVLVQSVVKCLVRGDPKCFRPLHLQGS